MNSEEIKKRVLERVMAPYPKNCHIVPYSTPVVSFGNPETSTVATLGINPSSREFLDDGMNLLSSGEKRLVDTKVLGLSSEIESLNVEQAEEVIKGCFDYFETGKYYKQWFSRLEEYVLSPANASYFSSAGGSLEKACHLDLVQWATDPVWSKIEDKAVQKKLLESDFEFLRFQLTSFNFKKLFLNGREVIEQFESLGLTNLTEVGKTPFQSDGKMSSLYRGKFGDTEVWGWGLNVQSKVTLSNLEDLSNWIGDDGVDGDPLKFDLSQAIIAYGDSRKKKYPSNDVSKITAVAEEFGLAKFEVKAKFVRDVDDILHIHPDMLVARRPFQGSRDRRLTDDNPYPNYPHFYELSGWSDVGSKALESKGIEKVLCPEWRVRVPPDKECGFCGGIHPKE
jgi:hypothetical protein